MTAPTSALRPTRSLPALNKPIARHPWPLLGAGCVLAYLVFLAVAGIPHGNPASDSRTLVNGVRLALRCIDTGTFTHCGNLPGSPFTDMGPYPPLQYLPALAFVKAGLTDEQAMKALAWLSYTSFVVLLGLFAAAGRQMRWKGWTPLLVVAVLGSPMLYQSTSTFGESLAAMVLVACVVAAMWQNIPLLVVSAFAAGISKETMFPFVVLLVLAVGRRQEERWPPANVLVATAVGLLGAVATNSALNMFRFGSPRNINYLLPFFQSPMSRRAELFGGLWVAPNVGLLFYATLTTIIVVAAMVAAFRWLATRPREPRLWAPAMAVAIAVAAYTFGLASWFTPWGWDSYGSRLFMPFLPAALLAAVYVAEPFLLRALRAVTKAAVARVGFAAAVAVVGLPQFASPWTWPMTTHAIQAPTPECEHANVHVNNAGWYRCVSRVIWRRDPLALRGTVTGDGWPPKAGMALMGLGTFALVLGAGGALTRARLPEEDSDTIPA